jgi:hypothetical protein
LGGTDDNDHHTGSRHFRIISHWFCSDVSDTAWIIWYTAEKVFPNEVGQLQFFLTFIVVIIPFVMLIYFGLDAIIDDAIARQAGWPPELPFGVPPEIPVVAVVYIGLTVWLGMRWRKLKSVKDG